MKIRYKISSFSSQSPSNPAINLASNSGDWQSARFCTYPQQITLIFYDPVIINKIKIVTHPTKVPQKISLLYHLPTIENQNQFKKIGYVVFKAPRECQEVAGQEKVEKVEKRQVFKELKVVKNLELNALYLRLILSQNHACKSNFFNQVALSSIQIQGTGFEPSLSHIQLKNDSLVQLTNFGQQKIFLLTQFKQKFIEREQYTQANQIKQIISQVQQVMQQIRQLNEQKVRLVHEENYTEAKLVKEEINSLKQQIQHMTNNFYDPNKQIVKRFQIRQRGMTKKYQTIKRKSIENDGGAEKIFENQFMKDKEIEEGGGLKTDREKGGDQENNEDKLNNEFEDNQSVIVNPYEHQQRIVPALLNKLKKSDVKSVDDEQQQLGESISPTLPDQPEDLSPSNEANSSLLAEFYEKLTIRKLYSKHWQFKSQALEEILADAKKHSKSAITKNRLRSYIFVYNKIMSKENNKLFILSAIELINLVTAMKVQQKDFKTQMTRQLQKVVIETLDKTQQNQNPKIKMQAQKAIIRMQESLIFGTLLIYHAIIKAYDDKLTPKMKRIYLDTLEYMISNSQGTFKGQIPPTIVDFAVKKLRDSSGEVKKSAVSLLKTLKKHGFEDRVKICLSEQKGFKQAYFKELS